MQTAITKTPIRNYENFIFYFIFGYDTFFKSFCFFPDIKKQYKTPSSILLREWRAIFAPPWLVDLFYQRMKKFESTKVQEPVKPSLKSVVSYQEVGRLSTTPYGIQQRTKRSNELEDTNYLCRCVSEH